METRFSKRKYIGDRLVETGNCLGLILRAARFCFCYSDEHDSFIRLRWVDKEKGLIELESCPPREIHYVRN